MSACSAGCPGCTGAHSRQRVSPEAQSTGSKNTSCAEQSKRHCQNTPRCSLGPELRARTRHAGHSASCRGYVTNNVGAATPSSSSSTAPGAGATSSPPAVSREAPAAPRCRGPLRRRPECREDSHKSSGSSCSLSSARSPIGASVSHAARARRRAQGLPCRRRMVQAARCALRWCSEPLRQRHARTERSFFGAMAGPPKSSRVPAGCRCRSREHARHPPHQPLVCVVAVAPFGAPFVRSLFWASRKVLSAKPPGRICSAAQHGGRPVVGCAHTRGAAPGSAGCLPVRQWHG